MRKPIALTLDYFAVILASLVVGLFFYTQYFNSVSLVAGKPAVFSKEIIAYGLFECLPIIFLCISMFVTFYKIRHKSNPVASCITYAILCLFTWLFLYPVTLIFQNKVYKLLTPIEKLETNQELSGGYFRKINSNIFYFVSDVKDDVADVFKLYDYRNPDKNAVRKEIDLSIDTETGASEERFQDPIIKDSMSDVPFHLVDLCEFTKERAQNAWENGIIAWLCFCTFGFALCSVYCFIKISSWKLVNAFWVLVTTVTIISFNYYYFLPKFYFLRTTLYHFFYDSGHLSYFANHNIDFPLMLINFIFGSILCVIGILVATSKKNKL